MFSYILSLCALLVTLAIVVRFRKPELPDKEFQDIIADHIRVLSASETSVNFGVAASLIVRAMLKRDDADKLDQSELVTECVAACEKSLADGVNLSVAVKAVSRKYRAFLFPLSPGGENDRNFALCFENIRSRMLKGLWRKIILQSSRNLARPAVCLGHSRAQCMRY